MAAYNNTTIGTNLTADDGFFLTLQKLHLFTTHVSALDSDYTFISASLGLLLSVGTLFMFASLIGAAANVWLLHMLHHNTLLHIPTYFFLALISLGNVLIGVVVIPLTMVSLYLRPNLIGAMTAYVAVMLDCTAVFWIVFLLLSISIYRLRIVGREVIDETTIKSCAAGAFVLLLISTCLAFQHLFTENPVIFRKRSPNTANFAFLPDTVIFLACCLVIAGCYVIVWLKSSGGHLRMVRHGRLFQNEFAQMNEWRINRTLTLLSVLQLMCFGPWILFKVAGSPDSGQSDSSIFFRQGEQDSMAWLKIAPLLLSSCSLLVLPCVALSRKDVRVDAGACLGPICLRRKDELPIDRSPSIRCIAFRNDVSEFK